MSFYWLDNLQSTNSTQNFYSAMVSLWHHTSLIPKWKHTCHDPASQRLSQETLCKLNPWWDRNPRPASSYATYFPLPLKCSIIVCSERRFIKNCITLKPVYLLALQINLLVSLRHKPPPISTRININDKTVSNQQPSNQVRMCDCINKSKFPLNNMFLSNNILYKENVPSITENQWINYSINETKFKSHNTQNRPWTFLWNLQSFS